MKAEDQSFQVTILLVEIFFSRNQDQSNHDQAMIKIETYTLLTHSSVVFPPICFAGSWVPLISGWVIS